MPGRIANAGVVVLLSTALACSDNGTGPDGSDCAAETTSVTATVTTGGETVFNWTPACRIGVLLVEEDASDMWGISAFKDGPPNNVSPATANQIPSPVTYGQVPVGVHQSAQPLPLVAGRTYDLVLWRALPVGSPTLAQCEASISNWCLLTVKAFVR
jgi:hypothetical protein